MIFGLSPSARRRIYNLFSFWLKIHEKQGDVIVYSTSSNYGFIISVNKCEKNLGGLMPGGYEVTTFR